MNRTDLENYILKSYGTEPDYPWRQDPGSAVFRHKNNKKWFALIMGVPKAKLGIGGDGFLDIVNFKCNLFLIDSLLSEEGFYPAYHMNKANWITVALDGSVSDDRIKMLLDVSFESTLNKKDR